MSEIHESKKRGRQAGPGIPFRKQTPKQRAVYLLIEALGNYGYPESKYIANKFYSDTLTHMNMPLLAGVLEFLRIYNIIDQFKSQKELDLSKIKVLTAQNIDQVISKVINLPDEDSKDKIQIDFIRYIFYALEVLRSTELTVDNSDEIEQLIIGAEK